MSEPHGSSQELRSRSTSSECEFLPLNGSVRNNSKHFRARIERMARQRENRYCANSRVWQLRMVGEALCDLAIRECEKLRAFFDLPHMYYPFLFEKCRILLEQETPVHLTFAYPPETGECGRWLELQKKHGRFLTLRVIDKNDERLFHFMLCGNSAYRLENPHEKINPASIKDDAPLYPARFSFNDEPVGRDILDYARELEYLSRPLIAP